MGEHLLIANTYRYNWIEQNRFYWQMVWRFPSLPAPTAIIADHSMAKIDAENPLSSAINWIYFHENIGETHNQAGYYLFYNEDRLRAEMNGVREPLPPIGFLGESYFSKYHLLTIENSHRCLQVVDPMLAPLKTTLSTYLKRAAAISDLNLSYSEDLSHKAIVDPQIFGSEPPRDWCYYFEKADLARSKGDWLEMLRLEEEAEQKGFKPEEPDEILIFLYPYIATGDFNSALTLSHKLSSAESVSQAMLCRIWENMVMEKSKLPEDVKDTLIHDYSCSF